jgi:hypothetical protein
MSGAKVAWGRVEENKTEAGRPGQLQITFGAPSAAGKFRSRCDEANGWEKVKMKSQDAETK